MDLVPLNTIFKVTYGNKLDLNKMKRLRARTSDSLDFIGRSARNNSVVAVVGKIKDIEPYSGGAITVALGGAILASRVQVNYFYTAQNVAVLVPIKPMTLNELVYYCLAIQRNQFRYGAFGREANRTLRTLEVPAISSIPKWTRTKAIPDLSSYALPYSKATSEFRALHTTRWKPFPLSNIFDIKKGKRLTKKAMKSGNTVFIGSSDRSNGVTAMINRLPIHEGNTISVCYNGSVGEAFYQPRPFWASDDVNVLYPKFKLNSFRALFVTTIIRKEKYRFSYGRKWHVGRMKESVIRLPVNIDGNPDWEYMESFIKSLPYSSALEATVFNLSYKHHTDSVEARSVTDNILV